VVASHPDRQEEILYVPGGEITSGWTPGTVDLPDGVDSVDVTVVVPGTAPDLGDGDTDCVDAKSLYELAMYAIDRDDLADLCRTHFGEGPASLANESRGKNLRRSWRDPARLWAESGRRQRVTTLGVVVLSIVLASTLVWAGPTGFGPKTGSSTPDTATGTADAGSTLGATPDAGDASDPADTPDPADSAAVVSSCPDPPTGVSPGDLRPRIESVTLDGWHIEGSRTVSIFDLMNRSQKATPEETFVGTYVGPDGRAYELRISRWGDTVTARVEAADRRAIWPVWEVWGAYSFGVRGVNETAPSTSLVRAAARELLAATESPSGESLVGCVDDLVEDRG